MSVLPKLPMVFFIGLEQISSQFVWKYKKLQIAKSNLEKQEDGTGGVNLSDFRLYYKATRQYGSGTRQKYRSVEQNRKLR